MSSGGGHDTKSNHHAIAALKDRRATMAGEILAGFNFRH
jgi:hypothetical protein